MRSIARILLPISLIATEASCARDRSASAGASASASARPAREAARLSRVEVGMAEDVVLGRAGAADEVRHPDGKRPWIVGASAAWAYGTRAPGTFAFGGLVLFDASKKVIDVRSPLDPLTFRARRLRWSDTADVHDHGLSCHLSAVKVTPHGIEARVTLKNDGAAEYSRRHGHTGIKFDLAVELFDEHQRVLAREDTLSLFSPYASGDDEVMKIPAGASISETVGLGSTWAEFGDLPAGRYFIRVAFPFEVGHFSVSEPVALTIGG